MLVNLIKIDNALCASLPDDQLIVDKIRFGDIVSYELTRKRNAKFHRKYFALLDVVVANSGYNIDQLLHLMKLKLGHYETVVSTDGRMIYIPKTISFAGMDQDTFEIFYSRTIDIILRDFFKNTPIHRLDHEVTQILGFS